MHEGGQTKPTGLLEATEQAQYIFRVVIFARRLGEAGTGGGEEVVFILSQKKKTYTIEHKIQVES